MGHKFNRAFYFTLSRLIRIYHRSETNKIFLTRVTYTWLNCAFPITLLNWKSSVKWIQSHSSVITISHDGCSTRLKGNRVKSFQDMRLSDLSYSAKFYCRCLNPFSAEFITLQAIDITYLGISAIIHCCWLPLKTFQLYLM